MNTYEMMEGFSLMVSNTIKKEEKRNRLSYKVVAKTLCKVKKEALL